MYFIYLNSWKCLLIYLYFMDYKTIITNSKLVISFQIIKSQWEKFVASNCSNHCLKQHENLFSSHYRLIVLESCKRITTAFFLLLLFASLEKSSFHSKLLTISISLFLTTKQIRELGNSVEYSIKKFFYKINHTAHFSWTLQRVTQICQNMLS